MLILECGMMSPRETRVLWGRGRPQHRVSLQRTQQQKVPVGRASGRGNYEFLIGTKQHRNKVSHRKLKDESIGQIMLCLIPMLLVTFLPLMHSSIGVVEGREKVFEAKG